MSSTRVAPHLGKGLTFPIHINRNTGGLQVSEGFYDSVSVAVAYIQEKWNLQHTGNLEETTNHVAESIYNILLTREKEWTHLPWYGSRTALALFEPNSAEFRLLFSTYLKFSTERWNKRAKYPENGVQWYNTGVATDRGELPLVASIEYETQQHPKNLVLPFVTVRQVRIQEYPASVVDDNGHDLISRYYRRSAYYQEDFKYIRLLRNIDMYPAPDDIFYMIKPADTWMLITYALLGEVRYWFYPYLCYIQDSAKSGGTRDILNPDNLPEPGTLLRVPSKERILLINSRR
jgi:hypothetical protein